MPPATNHPRALAATPPTQCSVRGTTLLLMTTLGAIDGTILLLAAQGVLDSLAGAILTGLTVIGGAGAWITARQAFGARHGLQANLALGAIAVLGSLAAVAAAALGSWIGSTMDLAVLPKAVGVVLLLVAAEVSGLRLPHLAGLPLPVAGVLAAIILEGVAQSTL